MGTKTKSTRNSKVTTENSSWLTPNGTDKSTNGVVKLWSVSNKSSCASTQDTTNNQLNRQVECLYQKWDARIKQWKLCAEQQLYAVKAKWEACMVSRKGKVSIFTRCLYGKRDHTRACLEQRLKG